ncbi:hypothetical protein IC615_12265 [Serratia ureilytica]
MAAEPVNGIAAAFVFDNMLSNTTRFANAAIADMAPRQLPWSLADRASHGAYPAIFHGIKDGSDNLFYAAKGGVPATITLAAFLQAITFRGLNRASGWLRTGLL